MKRFLLSSLFLLSTQFVTSNALAQGGLIDVTVANGVVTPTSWTYQIFMKQGAGYTPDWNVVQLSIDVDFGLPAPFPQPTITNVTQVLSSEATSGYQDDDAFGSPLPSHEEEMTIGFSNPGGAAGDLTSTYKLYSTVTVNFSSPIPVLTTTFSIRDLANYPGAGNVDARSHWATLGLQQFEINGANPDQSPLTATPLAMELLSFNAAATAERTAKLDWETATEKSTSHFIVERSADGTRFTEQVCRMQAAGTSNDRLTYHNFDYKPLTGNNYYRLKMVDKDGSFTYSETRRVVFAASISDVVAMPNPFQNATEIRVSADQDQVANYYLMDAAGRMIRRGVWEVKAGEQKFPMPIENAAAGNYILTVQGSTILAELRLTKTN
jgi:hypothetical protein